VRISLYSVFLSLSVSVSLPIVVAIASTSRFPKGEPETCERLRCYRNKNPRTKIKQTNPKKCIYSSVLKYQVQIYIHMQNNGNKNECRRKWRSNASPFFSSVGIAASRSVVITVGLGIPLPGLGKKTWRRTTVWVGEQKFVGDAT
jgi:hypothetical protein